MAVQRSKRIALTVQPETKKILDEYAEALGVTTTTAINSVLNETAPVLAELTAALRAAKQAPAAGLRQAKEMLDRAAHDALQTEMPLDSQTPPKRKRAKSRAATAPEKKRKAG